MTQSARDYQRIERAISYLDARWIEQPDLARIARHAGMSQAHFERMFLRWAGVSPMQFLRFLTKENAKQRLRSGRSVLDAALGVGLSGPGRLHDLMVTCEAVTPGEYRRGGAGVRITHGFTETQFGECLIASTSRGICALEFVNGESREAILERLHAEWPEAEFRKTNDEAQKLALRIFTTPGSRLRLHLRGTNFQLKVWQALLRIGSGELASYHDIARAIGQPAASRAVGSAVGANPISFLIPCHRVIRSTGVFGNYRWGPERKLAMCGWEGAQAVA